MGLFDFFKPRKKAENTDEQQSVIRIPLTGYRDLDRTLAVAVSNIPPQEDYVWHYLDDLDPSNNNLATLQYVEEDVRVACGLHLGAAAQVRLLYELPDYINKYRAKDVPFDHLPNSVKTKKKSRNPAHPYNIELED